jgi:hypothetical protein
MSVTRPGISVLLPIFFRHVSASDVALLRRALESVHAQAYEGPLEILAVDDGSPTPIESLAGEIGPAGRDVRWLRLTRNSGIVGALNAGLTAASHGLIARLDADDRWLPGKLTAQMALFDADPDLTITATGMLRVRPDGAEIDTHIRPGNWPGILNFFVEGGCPFPHGSVVARREVFQLLGGYPHDAALRHCEDYALWGTWLRFFKPGMVEKALYEYTVSDESVSSAHAAQQGRASQVVRQRFADLDLVGTLPAALVALASALGAPLGAAGQVAYRMWHHGRALALPEAALAPLAAVLPDRLVDRVGVATPWHEVLGLLPSNQTELVPVTVKPLR